MVCVFGGRKTADNKLWIDLKHLRSDLRVVVSWASMERDITDRLKGFSLSTAENAEIQLDVADITNRKIECQKSLIGKIFGSKKTNFTGFKNTMSNIWQTKEAFSICEIGYNLFQVVFSNHEDKTKVLKGKTWSFDSQYLVLREWTEELLANPEAFKKVEIWIQLWNIPFHWLSIDTGRKIGRKFGKIVDITIPDTGSTKGKHIKILVEINLVEPLMRGTKITLEEESYWVDFKYENLQTFCLYCGVIGHSERECLKRKEDLENNCFKDGQYGEWLRAVDVGQFRVGYNHPRSQNSFKHQEQNKDRGSSSVDIFPQGALIESVIPKGKSQKTDLEQREEEICRGNKENAKPGDLLDKFACDNKELDSMNKDMLIDDIQGNLMGNQVNSGRIPFSELLNVSKQKLDIALRIR
ncbi:hypothetical protein DH2020_027470 [Rehmannia glutinosa]|uniref:CCHC-type domain-containing protein n=1 Tax=Rehmannia glutinosa TaxID=99300 RepID=A0ABR0VXN6_REHGL